MAYMDQTKKAKLAPQIKAVLKKYKMKGSISVDHHTSLVVTVKSGPIDFAADYITRDDGTGRTREFHYQVNTYWAHEHYQGKAKSFLMELIAAMNDGNHDNSDAMTDYFDVGWYIHVNLGKWNKPYELTK